MKNSVISTSLVIASALLTACGQYEPASHQIVKTGPTSQSATGFIVSGAPIADVKSFVAQNPEAKIRVLNTVHNLTEVYNISQKELTEEFPKAIIERNIYLEPKNNKVKKPTLKQALQTVKLTEKQKKEDTPAPKEDYSSFQQCKEQNEFSPKVNLQVLNDVINMKTMTANLGSIIQLTTKSSQVNPKVGGKLKQAWVIYLAEGNKQKSQFVPGTELNFAPEAMGVYNILSIAQDKDLNCSYGVATINITHNTPFVPATKTREELNQSIALKHFKHLPLVNAQQAWTLSQGQNIVVAVIDSGVNYNHLALSHNILVNSNEIPGNGLDDDGNGYIDDYVGYDFLNSDPYPYDDNGHGSHVAGLTASSIFGVAPHAKILSIKALSGLGGDMGSIVSSIYYALDRGANILNLSFGNYRATNQVPQFAIEAYKTAQQRGALVITAAGNGHPETGVGLNTDITPHYPSNLGLMNMLSIAATGDGYNLSSYSNFGKKTVDMVAPGGNGPGTDLFSAYKENPAGIMFYPMSGTSMATPVTSGIAALVWAANPSLTALQVKQLVIMGGISIPNYKTTIKYGRLTNALRSTQAALGLEMAKVQLPKVKKQEPKTEDHEDVVAP